MNKAILIGRITRDPELKSTAGGVSVCSFTIAVNRRFKNGDGNYDADFINCVAWRQQAEFLCRHFKKGSMVGVVGSIQTRNYDAGDGQKVYVTEVAVDEVEFAGEKKTDSGPPTPHLSTTGHAERHTGRSLQHRGAFQADKENDGFVLAPGDDDPFTQMERIDRARNEEFVPPYGFMPE